MDSTNNPKDYRFQRILQEAAAYRTLRQVFDTLPDELDKELAIKRDVLPSNKSDGV